MEDFLQAQEAGDQTLPSPCDPAYYIRSLKTLEALRFIKLDKEAGDDGVERELKVVLKAPGVLALLWELREYPAEAVAVVHAIPWIMRKVQPILEKKTKGFVYKKWSKMVKIETVETEFLTMLLPIIDRVAPKEGHIALHEEGFVANNPTRAAILKDVRAFPSFSFLSFGICIAQERSRPILIIPCSSTICLLIHRSKSCCDAHRPVSTK